MSVFFAYGINRFSHAMVHNPNLLNKPVIRYECLFNFSIIIKLYFICGKENYSTEDLLQCNIV